MTSFGPYKALCNSWTINDPLFRWAVSSPCYLLAFSGPIYSWAHFHIRLLTARYCHFLLVGQIQPVGTVGPLIRWAVFMSNKPVGLFS